MKPPLGALAALFVAPRDERPAPSRAFADGAPSSTPTPTPTEPVITWQPPAASERRRPSPGGAPVGERGSEPVRWPGASSPEPDIGLAPPADGGPHHVAVLGAGAGAIAVAAAIAGELRARQRARTALLLAWDPSLESPVAIPAWPHARDVAASLSCDHAVTARGRLVEVRLPHDASAAVSAATRLTRGARMPTVLVLGSPRVAAFDDLLAGRDLVVVADASDPAGPVAALAVAELRRLNGSVVVAAPIAGAGRRLMALAGLGRARFLGERLDADGA